MRLVQSQQTVDGVHCGIHTSPTEQLASIGFESPIASITSMMDFPPCSGWGNTLGGGHGDAPLPIPADLQAITFDRIEQFKNGLFCRIMYEFTHLIIYNMVLLFKTTKILKILASSGVTVLFVSPSAA